MEAWETFLQHCLNGLTTGSLYALVAIGYTMVYGIIELVNFAHGDLVMLGCFLALTLLGLAGVADAEHPLAGAAVLCLFLTVPVFCGVLNLAVDRVVYRPLRNAPRLAPLVSAIGVSFVFMNIGLLWSVDGSEVPMPSLIPAVSLVESENVAFRLKDLMVIAVTVPLMIALTLFVKYTKLGTAMRATAQDPTAARLMGIPSERVIGATFLIGGALGGAASVTYALYYPVIGWQMGYQNGLYAFTAAVLGGIGKIPGAVLGGLLIGFIRSLGSGYFQERWISALIFAILIVILIFRPSGILGDTRREKV